MPDIHIEGATDATIMAAAGLLVRFFSEEGFATPADVIARNTRLLAADPHHWVALASVDGRHVGVVTLTTALYVEWGRLGEIGDLYVLPEMRRRGVAGALIDAAAARSAELGCLALSVVVAGLGQARHDLQAFYRRRGFISGGRMILTRSLVREP